MFNPELSEKPYLVAFNKMDIPEVSEKWASFRDSLHSQGIQPFCMSAVKREGTHEVISAAYELVRKLKEANREEGEESIVFCLTTVIASLASIPASALLFIYSYLYEHVSLAVISLFYIFLGLIWPIF